MGIDTFGSVEQIKSRATRDRQLANGEDISTGVTATIGNVSKFSLFIETAGAVNITIEFSPDGGSNWYTVQSDSPLEYGGAVTDSIEIGIAADKIRLTGSNTTNVTAQLYEVV